MLLHQEDFLVANLMSRNSMSHKSVRDGFAMGWGKVAWRPGGRNGVFGMSNGSIAASMSVFQYEINMSRRVGQHFEPDSGTALILPNTLEQACQFSQEGR
jgi:hypothetical protein